MDRRKPERPGAAAERSRPESEWTRPRPKVRPTPAGKPLVCSIFYGYGAEEIADWCGVTVSTARLYKAGKRKPSRSVMKLFLLHRDRRVLGGRGWDGWIVKSDSIVDPEGNETSRSLLHNYFWIVQFARSLAHERGHSGEFEKLLELKRA
jgi:hypothetical protein